MSESEWCQQYQVASQQLSSLFYLPDYVGLEQEKQLLKEVRASQAKWVQLSGRRLQNLGGVVHAKGLIPAPLPSWLQPLLRRLAVEGGEEKLYGGQQPNHVLVNSYMPGEGIMPHEDGPAYVPVVAILSLGAPAVLRFRRKPRPEGVLASPTCGPNCRFAQPTPSYASPHQPPPPAQQPGPSQQSQQQPKGSSEGGQPAGSAAEPRAAATGVSEPDPADPVPIGSAVLDPDPAGPHADSRPRPAATCYCRGPYAASVLLQPRSLVVFREEAFTDCLHSIEEVSEELLDESVANLDMYGMSPGTALARGGERISLTVRRVARVMPAILRR